VAPKKKPASKAPAGKTRPKPPNAGKGRPKGSKNKIPGLFKEAVALAFDEMGGVPALVKWAKRHQTDFYKIAARLIPHEIVGKGEDGEIITRTVVTHVYQDAPNPLPDRKP